MYVGIKPLYVAGSENASNSFVYSDWFLTVARAELLTVSHAVKRLKKFVIKKK